MYTAVMTPYKFNIIFTLQISLKSKQNGQISQQKCMSEVQSV